MRTKGSCQFAPYYKVERYDQRMATWRPIQKAFSSVCGAEAFAVGTGFIKTRIIKVTETGIEIVAI